MKVKIQVVIESDDGRVEDVEEVACLKRGMLTPEELGLNLAEAKQILHNVQHSMLGLQIAEYQAQQKNCPHCGNPQPQKGRHGIVFRTLFGKFNLPSLRLYRCDCNGAAGKTFSPLAELLKERTAPELLYLEAKWSTWGPACIRAEIYSSVLYARSTSDFRYVKNYFSHGKHWCRERSHSIRQPIFPDSSVQNRRVPSPRSLAGPASIV